VYDPMLKTEVPKEAEAENADFIGYAILLHDQIA
jgi:hypothetical protein